MLKVQPGGNRNCPSNYALTGAMPPEKVSPVHECARMANVGSSALDSAVFVCISASLRLSLLLCCSSSTALTSRSLEDCSLPTTWPSPLRPERPATSFSSCLIQRSARHMHGLINPVILGAIFGPEFQWEVDQVE